MHLINAHLIKYTFNLINTEAIVFKSYVKSRVLPQPHPKNDNDQFSETNIASNFDIAVTQIHVERFIGGICDERILHTI